MVHGIHIEEMLKGLAAGHRRTLSRVITLIESQREEDAEVKSLIMKSIGEWRKSAVKIGITGSPGVGKSTFLNGFVQLFEGTPYQIAILSIDPSSTTTGGSILGDKIRMTNLIEMEQVFIRPSPSKGILGGINVNTWETVLICEAAGFDYIFIETVGVGQSEIEIQYLTNEVWYLTMARSGDEIQTMKRGLMEIVDRIIVTKVDLEPDEARKTVKLMQQSLESVHRGKDRISFYTLTPFDKQSMQDLFGSLNSNSRTPLNSDQLMHWMGKGFQDLILRKVQSHARLKGLYEHLRQEIKNNKMNYWTAMEYLANEIDDLWES